MEFSESSTSVRDRGKNKRKWVAAEDDELIKALHEVSLDPKWRSDGSFKNGYMLELEVRLAGKLPDARISAFPHIDARLRYFKTKYSALEQMLIKSGFTWDDNKKMLQCEKQQYEEHCKNHPDAKGLYGVPFPYYNVLAAIYGKDTTTGEGAEDMSDAINNMQQELVVGNENNEEEEEDGTSRETPRRSIDSTSSISKRRKKEWKGNETMSNDPLLDMFNEVSGELKVVTKSVGKMAQAMEHEAAVQEQAMSEDPKQKLRERAVNEVRRLEFTGAEVIEAALVFVKFPDQMGMLFALPEPLRREYIVNMLRGGSTKFEEDGHLMPLAKMDLSHLDYQTRSSESNYVAELGSHAYSKESLQLGREYYSQRPYCTPSSCSGELSSLEAESSSPDGFGHVMGKMRNKTNTPSARPDLASYPTVAPDMRKYPAAINFDFDDSEHRYQRSDRLTGFSSYKGQYVEHHDEMVDYAGRYHYIDNETTPISNLWGFDDGGPSLPRGLQYGDEIPSLSRKKYSETPRRLQYGDEIPSLSRKKYNGAPPRSSMWHYGSETTSFTRRHDYGDDIPSLSQNWRYQDKIQSHTGHWCHDADAHPLPRYQHGAYHGNGHSRHHFVRTNASEQVKLAASKHTSTKSRMLNRIVNSSDHYRTNIKDKLWRNSEAIRDQVRGPRSSKLNDTSVSSTEKAILSPLVRRDQFNKPDFSIQYEHAKFFMIKSYSEDDIHEGIKYNVWASTPNGNNKLDAAYHEAQILMKETGKRCPVFLFFSVNTSGQFVGLAEMLGPVDFKKTMDFWKEDKWNGFFPITWHIIKDIPNRLFKHIVLENNNNRIVTFSRDTQEIGLPQGLEMLRIFKGYCPGTSILDDFDFYEEKDNARHAQKRGNSESTHQARFSDDYRSMENLEASMENWSLDRAWV